VLFSCDFDDGLAGPAWEKGDNNCIGGSWLFDAIVVNGRFRMQPQQSTGTWRAENTLAYLHTVLKELDSVGDFTVPSIVKLRNLIVQRISSVEELKATGVFGATVKYASIQGVPL